MSTRKRLKIITPFGEAEYLGILACHAITMILEYT